MSDVEWRTRCQGCLDKGEYDAPAYELSALRVLDGEMLCIGCVADASGVFGWPDLTNEMFEILDRKWSELELVRDPEKTIAGMREALEWYGERAEAISRTGGDVLDDIIDQFAEDAGKRAREALGNED